MLSSAAAHDPIHWARWPLLLDRRPVARDAVLPQYFKHNRMAFFIKQLRAYGFKQRLGQSCIDSAKEWFHEKGYFTRDAVAHGRLSLGAAPHAECQGVAQAVDSTPSCRARRLECSPPPPSPPPPTPTPRVRVAGRCRRPPPPTQRPRPPHRRRRACRQRRGAGAGQPAPIAAAVLQCAAVARAIAPRAVRSTVASRTRPTRQITSQPKARLHAPRRKRRSATVTHRRRRAGRLATSRRGAARRAAATRTQAASLQLQLGLGRRLWRGGRVTCRLVALSLQFVAPTHAIRRAPARGARTRAPRRTRPPRRHATPPRTTASRAATARVATARLGLA